MNNAWVSHELQTLTEEDSPITYGVVKPGDEGTIRFVRGGDLKDGNVLTDELRTITTIISQQYSRTLLRGGELLICLVGQPGQVGVAPNSLAGANIARQVGLIRLRPGVNTAFISYFLQSLPGRIALGAYTGGSVQQVINLRDLKKVGIPMPDTLAEQNRIVAILDEAFSAIDKAKAAAEKNLANARELFESYLNRVFTQKGDGWEETSVGELVESKVIAKPLDGNHGEIHPKKADFVASGVPFIMASHLFDGTVNQKTCHFITKKQANSLRKGFAKDGDVLMSHKGTIGRVAVLNTALDFLVLTPQVTYYRVLDQATLFNRFLYFYFQIPSFQSEIAHIAGAGSTRAYIGITKQLELPISYPCLKEQKRIAKTLEVLANAQNQLETIYTQKLAALAELKQSLLQKAFTGQLTAKPAELEIAG